MTEESQSYLRFSVEESVWFQRGQEVDDLVSISLDPDITIEEYDQYITIRGALQLTGEYRINETGSNETDETEGFANGKFINEVRTRDDGVSELKHRFPVDITIPKNRIQNLDKVYISIDSFDYERHSNNCLQLVADLSISGISNPAQQKESKQFEEIENRNEETDSSTLFLYEEDEDDVLEVFEDENHPKFSHSDLFAAYHDVNDSDDTSDEDEDEAESNNADFDDDFEDNDADLFTPFEVEARKEVYQDYLPEDHAKDVDNDDLYTPTEVEARKEVYQDEVPAVETAKVVQNNVNLQIEMKGREEKEKWSYPHQVDNRHEYKGKNKSLKMENNQETVEPPKEKRDENALYLTNIFAKDENQDFTRLKMYIVQTGDSLNTVSERYDVTVQQILRTNRFDQERTIQSGQILYIPVPEKSK